MSIKVQFASPEIGDDEVQEVNEVIKSGWLTTASRCSLLEDEFAAFVGARYALAMNSATAALHLGLEALGINQGDRVLVPTLTFTATAEVVRYLGADPIFMDSDRDTFCVTSDLLHHACEIQGIGDIKNDIKAIVPVHFGGHPCEMDSILDLAERYDWKVVEDAAHALPTFCTLRGARKRQSINSKENRLEKGEHGMDIGEGDCSKTATCSEEIDSRPESQDRVRKMIGSVGDVTCFSFYANKTITTGEGGMLCTDNDTIAQRVRVMRLHGINRNVWDRFKTGAPWEYDVVAPGFKYNMPDLAAALGIHQLRKAELFREKRQRIAEAYYTGLKNIPGLILPHLHCALEDHSWYLFMVLIEPERTRNGMGRNAFIEEMAKRDIGTSVHYKPLHRMTYYRERYNLKPEMFPNAEWIFERCVSLPIYSKMSEGQIGYVIKTIREILAT